jgi:non-canonical purine NTP pyrophosphatase (RdgB/HAM1 family)
MVYKKMNLFYVTSNKEKVAVAKKHLEPYGIEIVQKTHDFTEIQSESIEEIAKHKARQAFDYFKHPLLINDAGWYITTLNGFPGPYMKYINTWFTSQNLLDLMRDITDRRVLYREVFCFIDSNGKKIFTQELSGNVLKKPEGKGILSWQMISLSPTGKSIARCWEEGIPSSTHSMVWKDIAKWYKNRES